MENDYWCVKVVKNEMNQSETTGASETKYIKATWSKQEAIIIIIIIIIITIIITINIIIVVVVVDVVVNILNAR